MDDLSLLRLFVLVADTGSFTAVARMKNTTPSAVSRQISRLEENWGTRLLQRTTRKQSLTEAGEFLVQAEPESTDWEVRRTKLHSVPLPCTTDIPDRSRSTCFDTRTINNLPLSNCSL